MATKPVHEFTRAKIPIINTYCGLNISTETEPGSLGTTSIRTRSPPSPTPIWSSTTKLPPTTSLPLEKAITEEFVVRVDTTKVLLYATAAMAEQLEQSINRLPDSGPNPESLTLNHSEELNGLEALIIFIFLIIH